MTRRAALFLFVFFASLPFAGACDSASVYEDCRPDKELSGEERCFPSTFAQEDKRAREAAGFVTIGGERVPNALVSVDGKVTTTDTGGVYRVRDTPFRYDVAASIGEEVIALRGVAHRFLDVGSERDAEIKAFFAKLSLSVAKGGPGNRLAFFVGGDDAVAITGTLGEGFTVGTRKFETDKVTVHVVEYPETRGFLDAVASGSADLRLRAGTVTTAQIDLEPIANKNETMFQTKPEPPPGFAIDDIDLIVSFGAPRSGVVVGKVAIGAKVTLPDVRGMNWTARTKGTRADGAIASIGLRPFGPGDTVDLAFYAPPETVRNDGASLFATSAQGMGVFEHVLTPTSGAGKVIHVFSATQETRVPDLEVLGLPAARGEYRWTVRVFPDFAFVDAMSGLGNRLFRSASTSAPRTIALP